VQRAEEKRRCADELQQQERRREELDQQLRQEAEDKDDEDDLDWSDDGPDPEKQAVPHRAIMESFDSLKKLQDAARVRKGAERHALVTVLQRER
jgi:hypothetical protein